MLAHGAREFHAASGGRASRRWQTPNESTTFATGRGRYGKTGFYVTAILWWVMPSAPAAPPPTLPPDEAMAATLLEAVGDGFRIRETDHFTIAYDTPPEILRPLLDRLEGTYNALWRFCEGLGLAIRPPTKRFGVLLFDRHEDFERYRAEVGVATGSVGGPFSFSPRPDAEPRGTARCVQTPSSSRLLTCFDTSCWNCVESTDDSPPSLTAATTLPLRTWTMSAVNAIVSGVGPACVSRRAIMSSPIFG